MQICSICKRKAPANPCRECVAKSNKSAAALEKAEQDANQSLAELHNQRQMLKLIDDLQSRLSIIAAELEVVASKTGDEDTVAIASEESAKAFEMVKRAYNVLSGHGYFNITVTEKLAEIHPVIIAQKCKTPGCENLVMEPFIDKCVKDHPLPSIPNLARLHTFKNEYCDSCLANH